MAAFMTLSQILRKFEFDHVPYFLLVCAGLCEYVKKTNFVKVWGRVTKFSWSPIENELYQKYKIKFLENSNKLIKKQ